MYKWVALVTLILGSVVRLPAPVVVTTSGKVRGRLSESGRFYQYFGIPYATVNEENRFQAPLPPPKWEGIFEAIEENIKCPQPMFSNIVFGDPNCLNLNIYVPARRKRKLNSVMVFIHGGCFIEGTGHGFLYGADNFAENGVVFVGINYRLNVEGFLCLGIKEAPGNAGLKDQIAALKWVKNNIEAFGGDPNDVTLFGESAGAVSTSYLVTSPAAKELFHKVILQSGATLSPWGLQLDPISTASSLAKAFGHDTKDPNEIYKVLSQKTPAELINGIKYTANKYYITAETLFVPCVETEIAGIEPVIIQQPSDIIESGNYTKVPMILGFNDNEGIYFTYKNFGRYVENVDLVNLLSSDLEFPSEAARNDTVENLSKYYFSNDEEKIRNVVDLYSDMYFKFPLIMESILYSKTNDQPMYYYLFKYSGYLNIAKLVSLSFSMPGASHGDELFYMFKPRSMPTPQRILETKMTSRMVQLWTNFAKYSDPTPVFSKLLSIRWRPSRESNPVALVIDDELSTAPLWDEYSVSLWNDTYSKYRKRIQGFNNNKTCNLYKKKKIIYDIKRMITDVDLSTITKSVIVR